MTLPTDINIDNLTYTHDYLHKDWFYLDRLLDRMAPIFSINDPTPHIRELGALTCLPTELLLDILEDLSIIDLMRFGRCNRYSNYFVTTIPPLRTALRIAPNTVKGIMALQVSTHITAKQLCRKLHQRECDGCGTLAQCIYLPTCLRACFDCIHPSGTGENYFATPETQDWLYMIYLVRPEQLAAWPSFRPLLGTFTNGMNKYKFKERYTLYDCPSNPLIKKLGLIPWKDELCQNWVESKEHDRAAFCAWSSDGGASARYEGQNLGTWYMPYPDPSRETVTVSRHPLHQYLRLHMAAVIAPLLNLAASKAEQGVFCSTCWATENHRRLYTKDGFLEHLRECRVKPALPGEQLIAPPTPELWLCEDDE